MTTHDPIRAALERLIKLDDAHEGDRQWEPWVNAIAAARAALAAAPEGEGPSDEELKLTYARAVAAAVDAHLGALAQENVQAAQLAGLRAVLARWGSPNQEQIGSLLGAAATPPAPLEGEVGERDRISIDEMCEILRSLEIKATEYTDCTILYEVTFDQLRAICNTRAATLLEQLSAVAPAVVPIPVSERLPGAEDCHFSPGAVIGSCWCFNPVEHLGGIAWWSFEPLEWSESATHWLPAHALPLPTTTPAGQEEA